jgi:hypothetical protein
MDLNGSINNSINQLNSQNGSSNQPSVGSNSPAGADASDSAGNGNDVINIDANLGSGNSTDNPNNPNVSLPDSENDPNTGMANAEAQSSSNQSNSKPKKKRTRDLIRTEEEEVSLLKKISDYLVPILGLMVLGFLIAFVYVPYGTEALERKEEIQALEEDIDWHEEKIAKLESVNLDELNNDIDTAEKVIRDDMEVSEMAAQVEEIALVNDLAPLELSFSNQEGVNPSGSSEIKDVRWIPSYTDSISGPFAFFGGFNDIVNFLNDLRKESPTTLFIDAVNISRYEEKNDDGDVVQKNLWSVEINIFGYTCPRASSVEVTDPVNVDGRQETMDEIRRRIERKEAREEELRGLEDSPEDSEEPVDEGDDEEVNEDDNN